MSTDCFDPTATSSNQSMVDSQCYQGSHIQHAGKRGLPISKPYMRPDPTPTSNNARAFVRALPYEASSMATQEVACLKLKGH